jgi:hypothetical protein
MPRDWEMRERYPISEVGTGFGGHRQFEWVYAIQIDAMLLEQ